ncbi:MAG: hypothetical protein ACRD6N_15895 [Pyrinomonadaceae bacterium]
MSQLGTLIWLKWTLFRNSFRSSKATLNRVASLLGMLLALVFALLIALGLALLAYALMHPQGLMYALQRRSSTPISTIVSAELVFFTILAFCYLIWATLPLSTGSTRQFDPGNLLMYPVSLKKLFALDFISELTTLPSIFAVPAILACGVGAGLGTGRMVRAMIASVIAATFGLALTKWLSVAIGSLTRKRRTRGETLIAVIGGVVGLTGALAGQIAPVIFKHAEYVKALRWTPPGAAAFALTTGLTGDIWTYALAMAALIAYTILLVLASYWIARRTALGIGGRKRKARANAAPDKAENYTGWDLPLLSPAVAAVVEKELRYVLRNAQIRMMALMPLILIVVRLMNTRRFGQLPLEGDASFKSEFLTYGEGLIASGGILYIFLVLSGLLCNQFAFEEGGMRALVLSPIERKRILIGKNIAITLVALSFSVALLMVNQLIFRDLTIGSVFFAGVSFVIFAAMMSVMGNWFSVRFPKRMKFGKRLNVSGVVGLLLIPMLIVLTLPPLGAVAAGYVTRSLAIEYVTLLLFAALAVGFYLLVIGSQGEALQQREVEILEAVREPTDD